MTERDFLDDLFTQARAGESYLSDNGFTQALMAQLPSRQQVSFKSDALITLLFTALGVVLAAALLPVDNLLPLIPSSIQLSLPILAAASLASALLAATAFWAAETNRI